MWQREQRPSEGYKATVSAKFLVRSLLASSLLAFGVGRAARHFHLTLYSPCSHPLHQSSLLSTKHGLKAATFSVKSFDTFETVSSSSWFLNERDSITLISEENADLFSIQHDKICGDDDEHKYMAEHLMVDMKNVDGAFLNSERRLANAMLEAVNEAHLTLLSYYCHGIVPLGVSCVGLLKQNYISLHTWPERGVITLDLCVGKASSLMTALPIIERVFGVPRTSSVYASGLPAEKPEIRWAHKFRVSHVDKSLSDLSLYVLGDICPDIKTEVSSYLHCCLSCLFTCSMGFVCLVRRFRLRPNFRRLTFTTCKRSTRVSSK